MVLVDKPSDAIESKKKRMGQQEFRDELFKIYSNTCVISGNICDVELEAAHIVPYAESGSYDLSNGLLLTSNINPNTLLVEVAPNKNVGKISDHVGKKVNLKITPKLFANLSSHYKKFDIIN